MSFQNLPVLRNFNPSTPDSEFETTGFGVFQDIRDLAIAYNNGKNTYGAELEAAALSKFTQLDQLNNNSLISTIAQGIIDDKIIPLNRLKDGGRFFAEPYPSGTTSSGAFDSGSMFGNYNSSVITKEGEFIHNNSDYGGTQGNMTSSVIQILDKSLAGYGDSSKRYGTSWNTMKIDMGAGQSAPITINSQTYYLANYNTSVLTSENWCYAYWIRALDEKLIVLGASKDGTIVSGTDGTSYIEIDPSEGMVHITGYYKNDALGYNGSPRIYMKNTGSCVIAHPYTALGEFFVPRTFRPIPTSGI